MPIIQKSVSVASGAQNDNALSGEFFEFLPYNALVEVGITMSQAGGLASLFSGKDIVTKDAVPLVKTTSPVYPDDFSIMDVAAAGERLTLTLRNTAGTATTFLYTVRITPV